MGESFSPPRRGLPGSCLMMLREHRTPNCASGAGYPNQDGYQRGKQRSTGYGKALGEAEEEDLGTREKRSLWMGDTQVRGLRQKEGEGTLREAHPEIPALFFG